MSVEAILNLRAMALAAAGNDEVRDAINQIPTEVIFTKIIIDWDSGNHTITWRLEEDEDRDMRYYLNWYYGLNHPTVDLTMRGKSFNFSGSYRLGPVE